MKTRALEIAIENLASLGMYNLAELAHQELKQLTETLACYADEDNWGAANSEDWDVWQPTRHGYTPAQRALGLL